MRGLVDDVMQEDLHSDLSENQWDSDTCSTKSIGCAGLYSAYGLEPISALLIQYPLCTALAVGSSCRDVLAFTERRFTTDCFFCYAGGMPVLGYSSNSSFSQALIYMQTTALRLG